MGGGQQSGRGRPFGRAGASGRARGGQAGERAIQPLGRTRERSEPPQRAGGQARAGGWAAAWWVTREQKCNVYQYFAPVWHRQGRNMGYV